MPRLTLVLLLALAAAGLRAEGEILTMGYAVTDLDEADELFARGCLTAASARYGNVTSLQGPEAAPFRARAALGIGRIELVRSREIESARGPLFLALSLALEARDREVAPSLAAALVDLARVEALLGGPKALEPIRSALDEIARAGAVVALGPAFFVKVAPIFRDPPDPKRLRVVLEAALAGHRSEPDAPLTDRVEARGELARTLSALGDQEGAREHLEAIFPALADGSYFAARIRDLGSFDHPLKPLAGAALKLLPGLAKLGEATMLARLADVYAEAGLADRAEELRARARPEPGAAPAPGPRAGSGGEGREGAIRPSPERTELGDFREPLARVARLVRDAPGLAGASLEATAQAIEAAGEGHPGRPEARVRVAGLRREIAVRMQGQECDPAPRPAAPLPAPLPPEPLPASWLY